MSPTPNPALSEILLFKNTHAIRSVLQCFVLCCTTRVVKCGRQCRLFRVFKTDTDFFSAQFRAGKKYSWDFCCPKNEPEKLPQFRFVEKRVELDACVALWAIGGKSADISSDNCDGSGPNRPMSFNSSLSGLSKVHLWQLIERKSANSPSKSNQVKSNQIKSNQSLKNSTS